MKKAITLLRSLFVLATAALAMTYVVQRPVATVRPSIRGLNKPVDREIRQVQLVINWHILEGCNFGCRHCFAKWTEIPPQEEERCESANSKPVTKIEKMSQVNDVYRDPEKTTKILGEFMELASIVPPAPGTRWSKRPRLNIAGGEPFLALKPGHLERILEEADGQGFDLSIISNGSLISDEFIEKWASRLAVVGISMDSGSPETSRQIGRCTKKGGVISVERIAQICKKYKKFNPQGIFKVNTVVNALNWNEDMSKAIQEINPDKWKILQMLAVADTDEKANEQKELAIEKKQFQHFCSTHEEKLSGSPIEIRTEDDNLLSSSYIMVNPHGKFYLPAEQDDGSLRYKYSQPIIDVGAERAFEDVARHFNSDDFIKRYRRPETERGSGHISNTRKHKPIIFVGGVHGVGKSPACNEVRSSLDMDHLEASVLIEKGFRANGVCRAVEKADKRIANNGALARNQRMLEQGFRQDFNPNRKCLFAGHFVLTDKDGAFINVPEETFREVNPTALIVCLDDVNEIKQRASSKKGLQQHDIDWWREFQEKEKLQAQRVAKKLDIPYYEIQVSNTQGFLEIVKNVFNMKN